MRNADSEKASMWGLLYIYVDSVIYNCSYIIITIATITASAELLFLFWLQSGRLLTEHACHLVNASQMLLKYPLITCRTQFFRHQSGWAAFLHVGWHGRRRLRLTHMTTKTTSLWCVLLDLQTHSSNLQPDQSGCWFFQVVVLLTSVTHHHKPKHQMAEKPHKDLSVIHTKTESCSHWAAAGRRTDEIWRGCYHTDTGSTGCEWGFTIQCL